MVRARFRNVGGHRVFGRLERRKKKIDRFVRAW